MRLGKRKKSCREEDDSEGEGDGIEGFGMQVRKVNDKRMKSFKDSHNLFCYQVIFILIPYDLRSEILNENF